MDEKQSKKEEKAVAAAGASASDTFCRTMCEMICKKDVEIIQSLQTEALSKFEKTNEKFDQFNRLSAERYASLINHYQNHTKMLLDMKKDLDSVFRRIRNLKIKLTKQYGDAFKATETNIHQLEEELESQSQTEHTEEKPQTESQELADVNNTSNVEQRTGMEQLLADTQSEMTPSENQAAGTVLEGGSTQKHVEQKSEDQGRKTVYRTKLKPHLSSSDESYGNGSDDDYQDTNKTNICDDVHKSQQDNDEQNNESSSSQVYWKTKYSSSDESLESDSDDDKIDEQMEHNVKKVTES